MPDFLHDALAQTSTSLKLVTPVYGAGSLIERPRPAQPVQRRKHALVNVF